MAMNKFHQDRQISTEVDWLGGKLRPLRDGKGVMLSMKLKPPPSRVKRIVPAPDKIVTITPGTVFGLPPTTVQITVINNGSCFIEIDSSTTGALIRAGIPSRLAKALLGALHHTLIEENHGNCTTSSTRRKKRHSSGPSGFRSRRRPGCTTIPRSEQRTDPR